MAGVARLSPSLQTYKQTGNSKEVERFFKRMLDYEAAPGVHPYRWFYDTLDSRHVSGFPLPGMRALKWPAPDSVLPEGVAKKLQNSHAQIAAEASRAQELLATQEDAYPDITSKNQWTKLMLYSATTGWCAASSLLPTGWTTRGILYAADEILST